MDARSVKVVAIVEFWWRRPDFPPIRANFYLFAFLLPDYVQAGVLPGMHKSEEVTVFLTSKAGTMLISEEESGYYGFKLCNKNRVR